MTAVVPNRYDSGWQVIMGGAESSGDVYVIGRTGMVFPGQMSSGHRKSADTKWMVKPSPGAHYMPCRIMCGETGRNPPIPGNKDALAMPLSSFAAPAWLARGKTTARMVIVVRIRRARDGRPLFTAPGWRH